METYKGKGQPSLHIKATTWYKDSHSLFDYESTKIKTENFVISPFAKSVAFYRNKQSQQVITIQNDQANEEKQNYQFLTKFSIEPKTQPNSNKVKITFANGNDPASQQTNKDKETDKIEEAYLIVRKIKDINNEPKGYKLVPGQTIKLGRVQFFVSEVSHNGLIQASPAKCQLSRKVMYFDPSTYQNVQKNACKICLQQTQVQKGHLFNPCKCSGSCGTVHINCLMEWIHFKVKKEVVGGTLHYNFQKFDCQVCKSELPMIIDIQGKHTEMLPLQKPLGNYIILEGACQKSKSVMIIQNVPPEGIKLGRGHQCEIRITDISVSRSHSFIKNINGSFYLFDNKSKFGTLVRQENMALDVGRQSHGLQVGRTVLSVQLKKQKQSKQ